MMNRPMLTLMTDERRSQLIKQGAEARMFISELVPAISHIQYDSNGRQAECSTSAISKPIQCVVKYRFPKKYRHEILSTNLTTSRITAEARALVRCAKAGVNTPGILCVDEMEGILGLEVIDGNSIRELLGGGSEEDESLLDEEEDSNLQSGRVDEVELLDDQSAFKVMRLIGEQIAKMHLAHVIHGDLTTSNMMLRTSRTSAEPEVVLIDFGLTSNSTLPEDKAVDLYVLERAFQSTHPSSEDLFDEIMTFYQKTLEEEVKIISSTRDKGAIPGPTIWKEIKRKLDDVRLRGRKRSMLG